MVYQGSVNEKFYLNILNLNGFCGEEDPQCLSDLQQGFSPQKRLRITRVDKYNNKIANSLHFTHIHTLVHFTHVHFVFAVYQVLGR